MEPRVKLSKPEETKERYEIAFLGEETGNSLSLMGSPALSVRFAIGALIIKERLGTSDEETVEQIRENPYLQYFLGFKGYKDEAPFHPTMFVHFRKRIGKKTFAKINEAIAKKALCQATKAPADKPGDDENGGPGSPVCKNKGHP